MEVNLMNLNFMFLELYAVRQRRYACDSAYFSQRIAYSLCLTSYVFSKGTNQNAPASAMLPLHPLPPSSVEDLLAHLQELKSAISTGKDSL